MRAMGDFPTARSILCCGTPCQTSCSSAPPRLPRFDRLHTLFEDTFGHGFEPFGAGPQAFRLSEPRQQTRGIDDATPAPFVPGSLPSEVAWLPDENSRDFLGNEYLLWLWYMLDSGLRRDSAERWYGGGRHAGTHLARSPGQMADRTSPMMSSCACWSAVRHPVGQIAVQGWPHDCSSRSSINGRPTLQAETLAVSGMRLPWPLEANDELARLEERLTQLRHLLETLDLLYDAFSEKRASDQWTKELAKMEQCWARGARPG